MASSQCRCRREVAAEGKHPKSCKPCRSDVQTFPALPRSKSNNHSCVARARLLTSTALGGLLLLLRLNLRSLEGSASAHDILQRLVVSLIPATSFSPSGPAFPSHRSLARRSLPSRSVASSRKTHRSNFAHRSELLPSFATEPEKQPARIPRPIFTCDLTFPARARDPWTLPILTVLSAAAVGDEAVGVTHLLDVEKTRSQPPKLQCSEGAPGRGQFRDGVFVGENGIRSVAGNIFTTPISCALHVAQLPHGDPALALGGRLGFR